MEEAIWYSAAPDFSLRHLHLLSLCLLTHIMLHSHTKRQTLFRMKAPSYILTNSLRLIYVPVFVLPLLCSYLSSCICLLQTQAVHCMLSNIAEPEDVKERLQAKHKKSLSCLHSNGRTRTGLTENGFHIPESPPSNSARIRQISRVVSSVIMAGFLWGYRALFTSYLLFLRVVHTTWWSCISSVYKARIMSIIKTSRSSLKTSFIVHNVVNCELAC